VKNISPSTHKQQEYGFFPKDRRLLTVVRRSMLMKHQTGSLNAYRRQWGLVCPGFDGV